MDYRTARLEFINSKDLTERFSSLKNFIVALDQADQANELKGETREYSLEVFPHLTAAYLIIGTLTFNWDYWKDYESNPHEEKRFFAVDEIWELANYLELPPPHNNLPDRDEAWQKIIKLTQVL